jgi:hypothetical protein
MVEKIAGCCADEALLLPMKLDMAGKCHPLFEIAVGCVGGYLDRRLYPTRPYDIDRTSVHVEGT